MRRMTREEITDAVSEVLIPLSFSKIDIDATVFDCYANIYLRSGGIRINYGLLEQSVASTCFIRVWEDNPVMGFRNRRELQSALARNLSIILDDLPPELAGYLKKYGKWVPRKS